MHLKELICRLRRGRDDQNVNIPVEHANLVVEQFPRLEIRIYDFLLLFIVVQPGFPHIRLNQVNVLILDQQVTVRQFQWNALHVHEAGVDVISRIPLMIGGL